MRLLNIPKMYKEELLYSYLLRLAEANGFANPKPFSIIEGFSLIRMIPNSDWTP